MNLDDYRKDFNVRQFNNLLRYHEDLLDILKKISIRVYCLIYMI